MNAPVRRPWWFPSRMFYAAFDEGYRQGLAALPEPDDRTSLLRQRVEQRLRKAQRDVQGTP